MVHARHYTRAEASALLPRLEELLIELRDARDRLVDSDAHATLAEAAPTNGGGPAGRRVGEAFAGVRGILAELREREIVLRDIDRGLIDFPALIGGREAYLCWQLGEGGIGFWHELEAGFAGRRPLD